MPNRSFSNQARQDTGSSQASIQSTSSNWLGRTQSGFRSEAESMATSRSSTMPILKQEFFPVYDLDWLHLKVFLEKRFPGYYFEERIVVKDYYHFDVPEALTKEEKLEITKLRKKAAIERDASPERSTLTFAWK